jgi:hypothetical protein
MVPISCFDYIKYVAVALTRQNKGTREFESDLEGSKRFLHFSWANSLSY